MGDDREQHAQWLDDVQTAARVQSGGITLSEFEEGFVESIAERLGANRSLTERQAEVLKSIWDRI